MRLKKYLQEAEIIKMSRKKLSKLVKDGEVEYEGDTRVGKNRLITKIRWVKTGKFDNVLLKEKLMKVS